MNEDDIYQSVQRGPGSRTFDFTKLPPVARSTRVQVHGRHPLPRASAEPEAGSLRGRAQAKPVLEKEIREAMNATERKRAWRLRHPEASRTAERERAQARRDGHYGMELGVVRRLCASHDSYWKYEHSWLRLTQRLWWPTLGAGAHRWTKAERSKAITAWGRQKRAEFAERFAR